MELRLASAKPSPRALAPGACPPLLLFSPLKPFPLLRLPPRRPTAARLRLRLRLRVAASGEGAASAGEEVFSGRRELTGVQPLVEALPPAARTAAELAVAAAAVAAGYGIGLRAGGGSRAAAVAGAAVLGAASVAGAAAVNSVVPEVAAVGLHNYVAGHDDPTKLENGEVEAIAKKYGVSTQDAAFKAELCDLYARFVYSVLPPGDEDLKGTEVEAIIKFKRALGLDDVDAANMHMEIGRRIYRERLETRDRDADMEQRRAFQKLIYVSNLVFGDASAFLLPWKRLFGVTDSQIDIAMRENAKSLYSSQLKSVGRGLDIGTLIDVRRAQLAYKLSDEIAAEMFRDHAKKLVQENISSALGILKSRIPDSLTQAVEEVKSVIKFNSLLTILSKHPQADRFARGLGPVSLVGEYDHDRRADDLKILFKAYATEVLSDGIVDDEKLAPLNELRNIFGLGKREAEGISSDVKAHIYRKTLAKSFNSDLASVPSKAAFLQILCEKLQFDPELASKMHEDIYRQKLQQFVADGELGKEEVEALMAFQVRLCIPQETVDAAHTEICGQLFEKVVKEAIASVDGYDADRREAVRKAAQSLNLKKEAAMAIFSKAVRKLFLSYIQRAKAAGNRIETAKELKKLISFNTVVVSELLAAIKGEPSPTAETEASIAASESEGEDDEYEWESLETLRKTRPDKELKDRLRKSSQKEITLKDDLPLRDRAELYETYLMFCITGETTNVSFGTAISTKKDNSEFLMLKQLGDILGLTRKEAQDVHIKFSEKAFVQQAEVILADGKLTEAKADQLAKIQKQVGLPTEYAQKIIKNITTTKLSSAIEASVARGQIGIQQVRGLRNANFQLDSLIAQPLRESIYRKTVDEIFSSGTGDFDEEEVYVKIPADLIISAEKAKSIVQDIAKVRLENSLVQAIALLRQKKRDDVLSSLNDMLACDAAVPASQPLSWPTPGELDDLYAIYLKGIPKPDKLSRLQYLLGISNEKANQLRDAASEGALPVTAQEEEELAF
ncbi:protein TIC110, chloroplastic-like [Phragmites australis]|uniref:protein TIC110, chloroplastic-like n=1 Tax=Phragmites australis TaxID=29695 RepID=UPI002D778205|nr:protein TIC110, chloroplastic-like [Phragmites australis]